MQPLASNDDGVIATLSAINPIAIFLLMVHPLNTLAIDHEPTFWLGSQD
jgi:hypothetical protein